MVLYGPLCGYVVFHSLARPFMADGVSSNSNLVLLAGTATGTCPQAWTCRTGDQTRGLCKDLASQLHPLALFFQVSVPLYDLD